MEDILKSIKAFLYDRSVSPLFGAFAVAWAGWNYRFILILLSKEDIGPKLTRIEQYFNTIQVAIPYTALSFPFTPAFWLHGLFFPILIALGYIYLYPLAAKPVYQYSLDRQREIREIKQAANNEQLLSLEESREVYRKMAVVELDANSQIDHYRQQVDALNSRIKELEDQRLERPYIEPTEWDDADSTEAVDSGQKTEEDLQRSAEIKGEGVVFNNVIPGMPHSTATKAADNSQQPNFWSAKSVHDYHNAKGQPEKMQTIGERLDAAQATDLQNFASQIRPSVKLAVIAAMTQGGDTATVDYLKRKLKVSFDIVKNVIEELLSEGYIVDATGARTKVPLYELTDEGRKFAKVNNLDKTDPLKPLDDVRTVLDIRDY